ncbi:hypothetical protein NLJ89_g5385 [Agrocybe chaxingu]|uniref:Uncharacterized protein n=1 Tax=Agrocybe chaxingu TaxID=84603 RepID=A0A9W8K0B0_9AGAR|nr:hypothetical protein NLJ89_g5385 [Agrocybe chaxingu]
MPSWRERVLGICFPVTRPLRNPHPRLDQYLLNELKNYTPDEPLFDLLTFVTYPNLLWEWLHMWPLLGVPAAETAEREEVDRRSLCLMGLKQPFDQYRHILAGFLTDRGRAGRSTLDGGHYARVALKMARYLFEPKKPGKVWEYKLPSEWTWYRRDHDDKIYREKRAKETFQAGLQYLSFYLEKATFNPALVEYLEKNKLDPIRAQELPRLAWAEDKKKVEEGVVAYLERCKEQGRSSGSPRSPTQQGRP